MYKVISDIIPHWYDLRNTIVIVINFCIAKKMICELILIIIYHYGIKCQSNVIWSLKCYLTYRNIRMKCEIQLLLQLVFAMERKWFVHWCLSKGIIIE